MGPQLIGMSSVGFCIQNKWDTAKTSPTTRYAYNNGGPRNLRSTPPPPPTSPFVLIIVLVLLRGPQPIFIKTQVLPQLNTDLG